MSNLVDHARSELALTGNDPEFNASIINAIQEFSKYGHSGGSASVAIAMIHELLQFHNLTPLTDNPKEWNLVEDNNEDKTWQSRRNAEAFSKDGGKTYYLLSEWGDSSHPETFHYTKNLSS